MKPVVLPAASTLAPEDVALLRACLCDAEIAIPAFEQWKALARPEQIHNEAHFRLLPLLHDRLVELGVKDAILPKLRMVRHQSWARAQTRNRDAEVVLGGLSDAGVPTMVCKGMALIQGYYGHPALRPMSDIDILVEPEDMERAQEELNKVGWHSEYSYETGSLQSRERSVRGKSLPFEREGGWDVDFHWQPYHECHSRSLRTAFWDGAETITIGKVSCLRPAPASLLLHVITHGMRPNVLNPMRWMVDASQILRARGSEIDWPVLYRTARKARVLGRFRMGLQELASVQNASVAPEPRPMRPSVIEALEQRAFREVQQTQAFDEASARLLWPNRLRVLLSDAGRSPHVWRAYVKRKLGLQ